MDEVEIGVEVLDEELLPLYATNEAAGADCKAAIAEERILPSGESMLVPTGLRVQIPPGYEIQVRPRSGLALKHQVTVLNTPGTIDSDYRGEVGVILINHGKLPFVITPKMRLAQLIVAKVERGRFVKKEQLVQSARGDGGFGHTGTH